METADIRPSRKLKVGDRDIWITARRPHLSAVPRTPWAMMRGIPSCYLEAKSSSSHECHASYAPKDDVRFPDGVDRRKRGIRACMHGVQECSVNGSVTRGFVIVPVLVSD